MGEGLCETSKETKVIRIYREDLKRLANERLLIEGKDRKRLETDAEVLHRLLAR